MFCCVARDTRVAKLERVPVEDLVKRVVLWETFVFDVKELPSKVGFDAGVPWGIVPCDVALACGFSSVFGWVVRCMLVCSCIHFHQVLSGKGDGFENYLAGLDARQSLVNVFWGVL